MSGADGRETRAPREMGSDSPGGAPSWPSAKQVSLNISHLGRYRIVREIASGGMAKVYLAVVDGLDKLVALKVIHPNLAEEEAFVHMFLDEARIASSICHRNVCSVFDFGEWEGYYYIAMEYLAGQTLREVNLRLRALARQGEPKEHAGYVAHVIAEASEGLHSAHETLGLDEQPLHVVHRDVSPHNLFVTYDGNVSVVDFGIARAANRLQHTATGVVKGKFAYMAPEQVRQSEIDRRADVWSLGVCLWEGLTRERLFQRPSQADTLMSVLVDPIPAPSQVNPKLPPELDAITMRALARDLSVRYPTAREFARDLMAFCRGSNLAVGPLELELWMGELFADEITRKKRMASMALQRGGEESSREGTASLARALTHSHSGARLRGQVGLSHASAPPPVQRSVAPEAAPHKVRSPFDPIDNPLEARPTGAAHRSWWQRSRDTVTSRTWAPALAVAAVALVVLAMRESGRDSLPGASVAPGTTPAPSAAPLLAGAPEKALGSADPARASAPAQDEPRVLRARALAAPPTAAAKAASEIAPLALPPQEVAAMRAALPLRGTSFDPRFARARPGMNARPRPGGAMPPEVATNLAEHLPASAGSHDEDARDEAPATVMEARPMPATPPEPPTASGVARATESRPEAGPRAIQEAPPAVLRAVPKITELSAEGSLGTGVITRMLARSTELMRSCYAGAAGKAGKNDFSPLAVSLAIDETGSVREATSGLHPLPGFSTCVTGAVRRLRSDIKPDVGTVRVRFKVMLQGM